MAALFTFLLDAFGDLSLLIVAMAEKNQEPYHFQWTKKLEADPGQFLQRVEARQREVE